MKIFYCIVCFTSIFISGCSYVYPLIKSNTKESKKILETNITVLKNDSSFFSIPLPESVIQNSQIFLIGETHGISANQELELKMFKFLKSKTDIKLLLLEYPHSYVVNINKYLNTGNFAYIDTVFQSLKGTFAWTTEYAEFWKNLYAYNVTLDPKERFSCIGIDVEHQSVAAINFLARLTPDTTAFDEIKPTVSKLRTIKFTSENYNAGWALAEEISYNWHLHESLYKAFYGENYHDFITILQNIVNAKIVHITKIKSGHNKYDQTRDSIMYDNFIKIYNVNPHVKMYGFFGDMHVFQSKYFGITPFACRLASSNSPYKNKVTSICINYENCERILRPDYKIKRYNGPFSNRIFDFYKEEHPAFFGLENQNSQLNKTNFYPFYNSDNWELCQYILQVKNSKASQPYGNYN